MPKLRSHYDNLKISRDAPLEVIRAAYKSLTLKYHPDRNSDPDAGRVTTLINLAYAVLSDPERRAQHDEWIARIEAECAPPESPSLSPTSRSDPQCAPAASPRPPFTSTVKTKARTTEKSQIGRIGRATFLWLLLGVFAAMMLYGIAVQAGGINPPVFTFELEKWNKSTFIVAAIIGFHVSTVVARLHDRGLSGWVGTLTFAPIVNLVLYLYLLMMPGTPGNNRFGPPNSGIFFGVVERDVTCPGCGTDLVFREAGNLQCRCPSCGTVFCLSRTDEIFS